MKKIPNLITTSPNEFYPKVAVVGREVTPVFAVEDLPVEYDFILESEEALGESEIWVRKTNNGTFYILIGANIDPLVLDYHSENTSTGERRVSVTFVQDVDPATSDFTLITIVGSVSGVATDISVDHNIDYPKTLDMFVWVPPLSGDDILTVTLPVGSVVGTGGEQLDAPVVFTVDVFSGS